MRNLNSIFILYITFFFISCTKDENQKTVPIPCVTAETITDTISGFLIFEKGKQENGFANGIKINKPFESSVFIENRFKNDTFYYIWLIGYWKSINGHSAEAENITFGGLQNDIQNKCFLLTNNFSSKDSIYCTYSIRDDDVGILGYDLDLNADNALEIISFDSATKKLKAKFKGSFVAKKEYLPDLPKKVRFSDVYIEYGY